MGSEWGRLKEVVIGRADRMRYPVMNEMFRNRPQIYDAAERVEVIYSDMRETNRTIGDGMRRSHATLLRED